mgnify:CR=1 FL=1
MPSSTIAGAAAPPRDALYGAVYRHRERGPSRPLWSPKRNGLDSVATSVPGLLGRRTLQGSDPGREPGFSREQAETVAARLSAWLKERGLSLNQGKTRIGRIDAEGKQVRFQSAALEGIKAVDEGQRVAFETQDGVEALNALRKGLQPCVALVDLRMPGVTGLEALPDIRAASPGTRVVVYSQHIDPEIENDLKLAGIEAWLRKDEDLSELRATVLRAGGL